MLSVVLPALNESGVIEKTLSDAVAHLAAIGVPYEVLVVDNASTDNTVELVEAFAREYPQIRVIRHPRNLGYAHSNLTALQNARGEIIVVTDSDGQHTLEDLPLFLAKIEQGADIVYGWRRVRRDPVLRKIISAGLNASSRLLLGWRLHDINCGFRAVRCQVRDSVRSVYPVNYFGPELWVRSRVCGLKVDEVIVQHFARSAGASVHIPWKLPLTIWRAFQYLWLLRQGLKAGCRGASEAEHSRAVGVGR